MADSMKLVSENAIHQVLYEKERQLVLLRRSSRGLSESQVERDRLFSEIVVALRPLRNQRLLIDVRQAPGNNDPQIEVSIHRFRSDLNELFPITAVLVATAVGRLQISRMNRERKDLGGTGNIFMDEAEALAYLMSRSLA
jgi:hypothetical protein